jgi:hypothetical protein
MEFFSSNLTEKAATPAMFGHQTQKFQEIAGFQSPKQQSFTFTNTPAIVNVVGINYDELLINCLLWVVGLLVFRNASILWTFCEIPIVGWLTPSFHGFHRRKCKIPSKYFLKHD